MYRLETGGFLAVVNVERLVHLQNQEEYFIVRINIVFPPKSPKFIAGI